MNNIHIIGLLISWSVGIVRGQFEIEPRFVPLSVEIIPGVLLDYKTVREPVQRFDPTQRQGGPGPAPLGQYTDRAGAGGTNRLPYRPADRSDDPPRTLYTSIDPALNATNRPSAPPPQQNNDEITKITTPTKLNGSSSNREKVDVYDKVNFENDKPVVHELPSQNNLRGNATQPPVDAPKTPNGTLVTFDERSSFNGDQCPTGYARINGKCVETD